MGKGLDHKKPGPIGRRRDGEGACLKEEQSVEGSGPHWRPVVRKVLKGESAPCWSEEEDLRDGSDY